MIQQNITIFLGVDYTNLGNQKMLKQRNSKLVQLRDLLANILVSLRGLNSRLSLVTYFSIL